MSHLLPRECCSEEMCVLVGCIAAAAATDKSQQMSDWSTRPLTLRQQHYAALDAFVLPQLFDTLTERLGSDVSQQLVRQHTKTFTRVRLFAFLGNLNPIVLKPLNPVTSEPCNL